MRYTQAQQERMAEVAYNAIRNLMMSEEFEDFKEVPKAFKNTVWGMTHIMNGGEIYNGNDQRCFDYIQTIKEEETQHPTSYNGYSEEVKFAITNTVVDMDDEEDFTGVKEYAKEIADRFDVRSGAVSDRIRNFIYLATNGKQGRGHDIPKWVNEYFNMSLLS